MAQVTFTYNPTPAPACYPADVNGLTQLLTDGGMLAGTVPDNSGGGVYVGVTPPPSAITNKVWFKTDGLGRPVGVYMFYSGNWRKVYTGLHVLGEIRSWWGNPTGLFDGTGLGIVGSDLDGWAMCNGNNGTPNLLEKFLCSGTGWDGNGWISNPSGLQSGYSGGLGQVVIQPNQLPEMVVTVGLNFHTTSGNVYGDTPNPPGPEGQNAYPVTAGPGGPAIGGSNPFNNCPPYFSLMWIMFVGY